MLIERDDQVGELMERLEAGDPVIIVSSRSDGTWGVNPRVMCERLGHRAEVVALTSTGISRSVQRRLQTVGLGAYDTYGGAVRTVVPGGETQLFLCFETDDELLVFGRVREWIERHLPRAEPTREEVLSRQVVALTAERDRLAEQLREALQPQTEDVDSGAPVVFEDPGKQLRHEVWLAWLSSGPEATRAETADYLLGPDFLADLSTDLVDRPRVIAVMVEVLQGVVWDLHAREVHQMRESEHGGSPTRVRADGAVAWRAAIKRSTPGAPRLMWWALPDGTVEFARATHHDDTRMR